MFLSFTCFWDHVDFWNGPAALFLCPKYSFRLCLFCYCKLLFSSQAAPGLVLFKILANGLTFSFPALLLCWSEGKSVEQLFRCLCFFKWAVLHSESLYSCSSRKRKKRNILMMIFFSFNGWVVQFSSCLLSSSFFEISLTSKHWPKFLIECGIHMHTAVE